MLIKQYRRIYFMFSKDSPIVIMIKVKLMLRTRFPSCCLCFCCYFCQCPDSSSKNDLIAYIQRIALYSHQLTITARVKADVQMISGELVVSGVSFSLDLSLS